jgi:hypothetical protein
MFSGTPTRIKLRAVERRRSCTRTAPNTASLQAAFQGGGSQRSACRPGEHKRAVEPPGVAGTRYYFDEFAHKRQLPAALIFRSSPCVVYPRERRDGRRGAQQTKGWPGCSHPVSRDRLHFLQIFQNALQISEQWRVCLSTSLTAREQYPIIFLSVTKKST